MRFKPETLPDWEQRALHSTTFRNEYGCKGFDLLNLQTGKLELPDVRITAGLGGYLVQKRFHTGKVGITSVPFTKPSDIEKVRDPGLNQANISSLFALGRYQDYFHRIQNKLDASKGVVEPCAVLPDDKRLQSLTLPKSNWKVENGSWTDGEKFVEALYVTRNEAGDLKLSDSKLPLHSPKGTYKPLGEQELQVEIDGRHSLAL